MHTMCRAGKTGLEHFRKKQKAYNETIYRLLNKDGRTIISRFKEAASSLAMVTDNREKGELSVLLQDW